MRALKLTKIAKIRLLSFGRLKRVEIGILERIHEQRSVPLFTSHSSHFVVIDRPIYVFGFLNWRRVCLSCSLCRLHCAHRTKMLKFDQITLTISIQFATISLFPNLSYSSLFRRCRVVNCCLRTTYLPLLNNLRRDLAE